MLVTDIGVDAVVMMECEAAFGQIRREEFVELLQHALQYEETRVLIEQLLEVHLKIPMNLAA